MKNGWQTFETMPPIGVNIDVYSEDDERMCLVATCEWTGISLYVRGFLGSSKDRPLLWRLRPQLPLPHIVDKAKLLSIDIPTNRPINNIILK